MSANLRQEVLKAYRMLHRAKNTVFKGDSFALVAARNKINEEFKKNKGETNTEEIEKMIQMSHDVEKLLRKTVVQAKEKKPGVYELQMRADLQLSENVPYTGPTVGAEEIDIKVKKCCQEEESKKCKG